MKVTLLAYTKINRAWPWCVDNPLLSALVDVQPNAEAEGGEDWVQDADKIVEYAYRTCTRSTDKLGEDPGFIQKWIGEDHLSPTEHVSFTFLIEDISRACSHQIVRHRISSISQESQRRTLPETQRWVVPESVLENAEALATYHAASAYSEIIYHRLVELGTPKEDARFLLPAATVTRLVLTMNARSLFGFFAQRLAPAAQWEIREVAAEMLILVKQVAPKLFEDVGP